jgi:hypothetical protein
MLTHLLSRLKPIAGLFFDQERHQLHRARSASEMPSVSRLQIVVFKERFDNETVMFTGPTDGVY